MALEVVGSMGDRPRIPSKNGDLLGFNGDLLGFYGDFVWDFMVIYGDLMGFMGIYIP